MSVYAGWCAWVSTLAHTASSVKAASSANNIIYLIAQQKSHPAFGLQSSRLEGDYVQEEVPVKADYCL